MQEELLINGLRPKFADFLKFVKDRATLVNNEFGEDLNSSTPKARESTKRREEWRKFTSLAAGVYGQRRNSGRKELAKPACSLCLGDHWVWRCDKFKALSYQDKKKVVHEKSLCIKCLHSGHYARTCPKTHFRCQADGNAAEIITHCYIPLPQILVLRVTIRINKTKEGQSLTRRVI